MVKRKWWNRASITTACEVIGAGCVTVAAGMVAVPLGLAVGGSLLIAFGWLSA